MCRFPGGAELGLGAEDFTGVCDAAWLFPVAFGVLTGLALVELLAGMRLGVLLPILLGRPAEVGRGWGIRDWVVPQRALGPALEAWPPDTQPGFRRADWGCSG